MTGFGILRLVALVSALSYGVVLLFGRGPLFRQKQYLLWLTLAGVIWLVVGEPALRGWQQYQAWINNPVTAALVTGEHWDYIYLYTWGRFLAWRVVGVTAAGIIYWLSMRFIVKPSDGFKLNRGEALLISIGIALAGWPGFVLYLIALLLLYVGILTYKQARFSVERRSQERSNLEVPGRSDLTRSEPLLRTSASGLRLPAEASAKEGESAGGEPGEPPRFPVALPATLALITIPFIQQFLIWATSTFGINFLLFNVTNLSI